MGKSKTFQTAWGMSEPFRGTAHPKVDQAAGEVHQQLWKPLLGLWTLWEAEGQRAVHAFSMRELATGSVQNWQIPQPEQFLSVVSYHQKYVRSEFFHWWVFHVFFFSMYFYGRTRSIPAISGACSWSLAEKLHGNMARSHAHLPQAWRIVSPCRVSSGQGQFSHGIWRSFPARKLAKWWDSSWHIMTHPPKDGRNWCIPSNMSPEATVWCDGVWASQRFGETGKDWGFCQGPGVCWNGALLRQLCFLALSSWRGLRRYRLSFTPRRLVEFQFSNVIGNVTKIHFPGFKSISTTDAWWKFLLSSRCLLEFFSKSWHGLSAFQAAACSALASEYNSSRCGFFFPCSWHTGIQAYYI